MPSFPTKGSKLLKDTRLGVSPVSNMGIQRRGKIPPRSDFSSRLEWLEVEGDKPLARSARREPRRWKSRQETRSVRAMEGRTRIGRWTEGDLKADGGRVPASDMSHSKPMNSKRIPKRKCLCGSSECIHSMKIKTYQKKRKKERMASLPFCRHTARKTRGRGKDPAKIRRRGMRAGL